MINYEDKTNSQINVQVHLIVDPEWKDSDELDVPNYCEDPSVAWPIIIENRIAIIPTFDEWTASFGGPEKSRRSYMARNIGPLRAAMICFLKIQEAK